MSDESLTSFVVVLCERQSVDIERVLIHNFRALLKARGLKQADVVKLVGHSSAWLSRILNPPEGKERLDTKRGMRMVDLERVAKVFGVEPYELLKPGLSRWTERRRVDRRHGERRVSDRRQESFPPPDLNPNRDYDQSHHR